MKKQIERLVFQVEKQNKEAAAVVLYKGFPALRRGQGVGRIVDLQLALYVDGPNGEQELMYKWPNPEKKLPPLVMFSLHECGKSTARFNPEDLAIFIVDENATAEDEPLLVFATGSSNDSATGYIRVVEESLDGVQYAWLVFICQETGRNKTTTLFGAPETISALSQTIGKALPLETDSIHGGDASVYGKIVDNWKEDHL